MTATHIPFPEQSFPQDILELQAQVDSDPTDLVAKITLASALEEAGFLPRAAAVYREIIELDLSENSQPSHSKPSPHFLEIPKSI
jgi:thioredoxin-like negative regulator of GroEL